MSSLILYVDSQFTSPYAMSAFVALTEKKLPFELRTVNLEEGEHKTGAYRDYALTGRVPALVHGDLVLNESTAITEYLDEIFPDTPMLPRDVRQRAQARQVQAWIRSDLLPVRTERHTGAIFHGPIDKPLSATAQEAAQRLFRIAERLVQGPNLFGEWCLADLDLALMLNRLVMNGDPVPAKLADYATNQWQRPSIQAWVKHGR